MAAREGALEQLYTVLCVVSYCYRLEVMGPVMIFSTESVVTTTLPQILRPHCTIHRNIFHVTHLLFYSSLPPSSPGYTEASCGCQLRSTQ